MRLIDADELEELFREVIGDIAKKPEINGAIEHMVRASAMVVEMIHDAPTIEPRKKGKWIKMSDADGDYYVCDQCGEELPRYTTEPATWGNLYPPKYSVDKTDFCPHCGADMRGGEDEQT